MLLHEAETLLSRGRGADPFGYRTKKIANNTYLVEREEGVAVRLHKTDIVLYRLDGSIVLNSGGWRTVTTKERMNKFLPSEIDIYQINSVWLVSIYQEDEGCRKVYHFEEEMEIQSDFTVLGAGVYTDRTQKRSDGLKKLINRYVNDFMTALTSGEVTVGAGDCWSCLYMMSEDEEHIRLHIEESYFVGSLLINAMKAFPSSMAARSTVSYCLGMDGVNMGCLDQIKRSLRRYLYRHFGFAS